MSLESTVQRLENSVLAEANDARHESAQVAALQNARTRQCRELPREPRRPPKTSINSTVPSQIVQI